MNLIEKLKELKATDIKKVVDDKLLEFASFKDKHPDWWFSELCFCILTANSKAKTAMDIQDRMGKTGFYEHPPDKIRQTIIDCKHRFHNNKTDYIVCAREHLNIKDIMEGKDETEAREWIVENVKGIGYKEASHFLRNVGYIDVAILDRHILRLLKEQGFIEEIKPLTKKRYLEIEAIFKDIAEKSGMTPVELDLYMWYMKTGTVLK